MVLPDPVAPMSMTPYLTSIISNSSSYTIVHRTLSVWGVWCVFCMCMCTSIHVYMRMSMCVCLRVCVHLRVCICIVCTRVCMCLSHACVFACACVHEHVPGRTDVVFAHFIAAEVDHFVDKNRSEFSEQFFHHCVGVRARVSARLAMVRAAASSSNNSSTIGYET